jgi:hypothetical protein
VKWALIFVLLSGCAMKCGPTFDLEGEDEEATGILGIHCAF